MKLVKRMPMPRVCKAVIKAKGGYFEESKILKYVLICLTRFWLLHDSMCYFIVLTSSLLFYNVENSKNKEKPWNYTPSWHWVRWVCVLWLPLLPGRPTLTSFPNRVLLPWGSCCHDIRVDNPISVCNLFTRAVTFFTLQLPRGTANAHHRSRSHQAPWVGSLSILFCQSISLLINLQISPLVNFCLCLISGKTCAVGLLVFLTLWPVLGYDVDRLSSVLQSSSCLLMGCTVELNPVYLHTHSLINEQQMNKACQWRSSVNLTSSIILINHKKSIRDYHISACVCVLTEMMRSPFRSYPQRSAGPPARIKEIKIPSPSSPPTMLKPRPVEPRCNTTFLRSLKHTHKYKGKGDT